MAIYGVTEINDYMKRGSALDYCTICAKKLCKDKGIGFYEAQEELKGKLENNKAVILRTSGVDQCICMNCIKDIYSEHVAPTLEEDTK